MSVPQTFLEQTLATIETWRGIEPPNDAALTMAADLAKVIQDFEAQRGTLKFEDEPSSFEAALLESAAIEVTP
jgi:hypothetical protein